MGDAFHRTYVCSPPPIPKRATLVCPYKMGFTFSHTTTVPYAYTSGSSCVSSRQFHDFAIIAVVPGVGVGAPGMATFLIRATR